MVISNLKARDLTPAQQEILTRFCGEMGGGLLLLGGAQTFDDSWQGTPLEKLLPVTMDSNPGLTDVDEPFHLKLTDDALRSPVFQLTDDNNNSAAWGFAAGLHAVRPRGQREARRDNLGRARE